MAKTAQNADKSDKNNHNWKKFLLSEAVIININTMLKIKIDTSKNFFEFESPLYFY